MCKIVWWVCFVPESKLDSDRLAGPVFTTPEANSIFRRSWYESTALAANSSLD